MLPWIDWCETSAGAASASRLPSLSLSFARSAVNRRVRPERATYTESPPRCYLPAGTATRTATSLQLEPTAYIYELDSVFGRTPRLHTSCTHPHDAHVP